MAECYNKIYIKKYDIQVECGKCLNCIENRKKEAATRMALEMKNYTNKYFVTLTYDPLKAEYDKEGLTILNKKHVNAYVKALQYVHKQHYIDKYNKNNNKMVYLVAGEYSESKTQRAHYHMIIMTNIYIERYLRTKWKYGKVDIQKMRDIRAISYTTGYSIKKIGQTKKEREVDPFVKWSRGLGGDWIKERIVAKLIKPENYYVETIAGKNKLPKYFKKKIKEAIMGVKPIYRKLTNEERLLRKIHFGEDSKTIMVNYDTYYENYWKWEKFINKIKENAKKRDVKYLLTERLKKTHGDNWQRKVYNLLYSEKWEELDEVEREFTDMEERMNIKRRYEAELKYWRKLGRRNKIA